MNRETDKLPEQKLEGHPAMEQWNPNWRHAHVPGWFKQRVRQVALQKGRWVPGSGPNIIHFLQFSHYQKWARLWDHFGSIPAEEGMKTRPFITQPYGGEDIKDIAYDFAEEHDLELIIFRPGVWHSMTWFICYCNDIRNRAIFSKQNI